MSKHSSFPPIAVDSALITKQHLPCSTSWRAGTTRVGATRRSAISHPSTTNGGRRLRLEIPTTNRPLNRGNFKSMNLKLSISSSARVVIHLGGEHFDRSPSLLFLDFG